MRVLIVDDDPGYCESAVELLKMLGHNAISASDERSALVRVSEAEVVFVDAWLDKKSEPTGLEIIKEVKKLHPDIRIFLLSGDPHAHEWAEKLGVELIDKTEFYLVEDIL